VAVDFSLLFASKEAAVEFVTSFLVLHVPLLSTSGLYHDPSIRECVLGINILIGGRWLNTSTWCPLRTCGQVCDPSITLLLGELLGRFAGLSGLPARGTCPDN
jgi:hypothetical protein